MSTPRTKRQFAGASADPAQRQITSFFNKSAAHTPTTNGAVSRQPDLPSSVQANLLSVGMRVRKSVPEGYKTTGPSAFKLWTDNSPLPTTTSTTTRAPTKANSRELLPFCGINKVGGLATQPEFEQDEIDELDWVPALDSIPELTMSQESADSVGSSLDSSRKRIFNEEDDEVNDRREATPGNLSPGSLGNVRVMAIPHSRSKKHIPFKGAGQENMAVDSDFPDAEFLVYDGEADMDLANE
ncbi:ribonucleotide reductase inhibitor-domain-containing protein [Thelonectria olida]|uniref:Ribonucleotide reductase inhibitor-domain-containing protein n=1 Tax=Thelonectria olida TaxID=1576542 RepID=A0A9P8W1L7_9HYPO|nr:ribonucleotide reductase inhibitor-domain-containing protein [Thelonectria olida]